MLPPVQFLIVVILASALLGFPVRRLLMAFRVVDHPNARSSHSVPVVRGGGIAVVVALLAGIALTGSITLEGSGMIALAFFGLAAVSFVDDLKSVGSSIRFGCHLAAAVLVIATLNLAQASVGFAPADLHPAPLILAWPLVVLWVVGYTNAFNFMDGINGIAAGQAAITGLGMALLGGLASGQGAVVSGNWAGVSSPWSVVNPPALWSLALAGAALGFLPHNFPKARMFMGDVGSAPIGFLLAVLTLWVAKVVGWWLLVPLVLLHANFVLDTGITLVRRILRGERWYDAHREHFYQRLIRSGSSHSFVTGWEMALQAVVLGLMVLYLYASTPMKVGLIFLVIILWLAFFGFCERSFIRSNHKQNLEPETLKS